MSAKDHDTTHRAGASWLPRHEPAGRPAAARSWVSESIGFDSRTPDAPAPVEAGPDHFDCEKVSVDEARTVHDAVATVVPQAAPRPRPAPPREPLLDETIDWLGGFSAADRPQELSRLFPRIANKLATLWRTPALCDWYLSNLLMDSRDGAREGFPMAVAAEMATLLRIVGVPGADAPRTFVEGAR